MSLGFTAPQPPPSDYESDQVGTRKPGSTRDTVNNRILARLLLLTFLASLLVGLVLEAR